MNAHPDLLAGLRDIHLPAPVSFWPPAPGWWLLVGLAAGIVAAAVVFARRRRRSLRRAALAELDALEASWVARPDAAALAGGLSALLRRVALSAFGAARVAALCGDEWCRFVVETGTGFTPELARSLLDEGLYRRPDPSTGERASGWIDAVRGWIRSNT